MSTVIKAKRKPKARRPEIIIAVLEERIGWTGMLPTEENNQRIHELLDELKRSLGSGKGEEESGE